MTSDYLTESELQEKAGVQLREEWLRRGVVDLPAIDGAVATYQAEKVICRDSDGAIVWRVQIYDDDGEPVLTDRPPDPNRHHVETRWRLVKYRSPRR